MIVPGALTDLKVLEIGELTAAPYAAKLFGDYGAEVVKVERAGVGDAARRRGPFPSERTDPECSGSFLYLNTNKLSVALALDQRECQLILDGLLRRADVFITNHDAKTLEGWDLSPSLLRTRYPRLIVTTITPFGMDGPYADYLGDELVTSATGGIVYSTPGMPDAPENPDREPPLHPGCPIAETAAGLVAASASMVAVFGRSQSDEGCHLDVSHQAAVAAMQQRDVSMCSYSGIAFNRMLNPTVIGRMPNFYLPCKDGYVVIAAFLDPQWRKLVAAMGSPAWATSEGFTDAAARQSNWVELRLRLIEWTIGRSGDELSALAEERALPLFPFYPIRRLVESPQVRHRNSLVDVGPSVPGARMPGSPIGMQGTPWNFYRPAPRLGEHTFTVLRDWLGLTHERIERLATCGAI